MSCRAALAVVVPLLLLVGAVGCGGGSDGRTVEKAEFVHQANNLCAKIGREIAAAGATIIRKSKDPTSAKAQTEITGKVLVPSFEKELQQLRALDAPSGEEPQVERVMTALNETVTRLRTAPPIETNSSFKENHPYRPGEEIAAAYGLTSCGHP